MASEREATVDGAEELERLKKPEGSEDNGREDKNDETSQNGATVMAEAVPASAAAERPEAGGIAAGADDEDEEAATKTGSAAEDDTIVHSRQATTETDDKGSITPSSEQYRDRDGAEQPQQQQQQTHNAPKDRLVLEKYTLYKTESVSWVLRMVVHSAANTADAQTLYSSAYTSSARIKAVSATVYSR